MKTYWLTDRTNGEVVLVDSETIERLLGVEFGYVEWCIEVDGVFENGKWKVAGQVTMGGKQTFAADAKVFSLLPKADIRVMCRLIIPSTAGMRTKLPLEFYLFTSRDYFVQM